MDNNFDWIGEAKADNKASNPGPELKEKKPAMEVSILGSLDIDLAKRRFAPYRQEIIKLKEQVERFKVESDADVAELTAVLGLAATLRGDIEKKRKAVIEIPDDFVRKFNSFVKGFRDLIDGMIKTGKRKIGEHSYKLELIRREKQKKLEEAARKKQAELDKLAEEKKVEKVVMETPVFQKKTGPTRTETGKSSTKYVWAWKPVKNEFDKVPHQYLMHDPKAIMRAIEAGIREIPGIRIFEKPVVSIYKA